MPLLLKKEENNNTILVWKISEPLEELISLSTNLSFVPEPLAPPKGCCPTTAPVGLSLI